MRKRYFFDGEIEVCVLLDSRDGRLYASALPNSLNDFSAGSTLGRHPLSCRRVLQPPSSVHSLFFRFRPVHNWFPSSACCSFDEFFKVQRGRNDEESTDTISVSSTLCPSASRRPYDPIPFPSSFLVTLFFYQFSRANPFCALHLLITNDKFVLRLHRWDRTEANSHCRKFSLGHTVHPAFLFPHRPVPLIQNFKNKSTRVS